MKHAIAALLIILLSLGSSVTSASTAGSWYVYPTYANPPQKVIDTENIVYFTSGGSLFSYDKKNEETFSYTIQNKINDTNVTGIYYNYQRHYLLICYASGNIDLLYDDGRIKNLSDISDSSIPAPLTINNVCFDGDNIYVATVFGIVKFNEPRGEVVSSGNYGKSVNAVCVVGDYLIIHVDNYFYRVPKSSMLSTFDLFSRMYSNPIPADIIVDSDESMIVLLNQSGSMLSRHEIVNSTGALKKRSVIGAQHSKPANYLSCSASGDIYYVADNKLYSLDVSSNVNSTDVSETLITELPDEFSDGVIGTTKGAQSVWSLTRDGLGNYAFDGDGGLTVMMDRFKPEGISVFLARYFFPSKDDNRLYVQNSGVTNYRFGGPTRGLQYNQSATCIDLASGEYEDATAYPVYAQVPAIISRQKTQGNYAIAPVAIAELPSDPEVRFIATSDDGVYKVRGTDVEGRYGHLNSPITFIDNRDVIYGMGFDNAENLWVSKFTSPQTCMPLCILPADKAKLPADQITESDWIHPEISEYNFTGGQDTYFLFCKKSSLIVIISNYGRLLVCNTHGKPNDFSGYSWLYLGNEMTDQDGNKITPRHKCGLAEDNDGNIWIGTEQGLFSISPSLLFSNNPVFTHIKIPRNDGTNLADYLLATDFAVDISVDAANRKWIATTTSGVYCVSPNGDRIIHNFTSENSPLPTSYINCIYADKKTGTIYIGTDYGMFAYSADASAPKENYDDLLIYPNPVRPDFHGHVTVSGLMDNSLVKIADASGHVVHQGRSEGGSFSWNVCNSAGVRVPTGVYYILVSQNASGSSAAVGKIMVVN